MGGAIPQKSNVNQPKPYQQPWQPKSMLLLLPIACGTHFGIAFYC